MSATAINDMTVTELVGDAFAAPSTHNAQPWRFLCHCRKGASICTPMRAMPTVDPPDRRAAGDAGRVQMILRLGYGPMGARTPRRAARDVLEVTP
ncbi:hypothetical protein ITI46_02105 [Streptomyces oryzae]|uniref:Nitroreductase domain-containing protein n=1 Tax=Streptomyces oryzae TaxID=1434886 RepID=A0ABS3X562_9ACTN|nr:hypothetical protein [Streptomyces oryzae]MBO8190511.1 hypothetical protein [Streptomyces oryzae]